MKQAHLFLAVIVSLGLIAGCSKKKNESQQNSATAGTAIPNAVAGIHWTVPSGWTAEPRQQMRAATYRAPSPKEGVEPGDCGVFYFGKGQGGSVEDNLKRWIGQFENGGRHEFSSKEVNNLRVTTVRVSGTYLSPSGPMMESLGKKPNYRLLGAIVEAPEGTVFFKFTGPDETIKANDANFNELIDSLEKDKE